MTNVNKDVEALEEIREFIASQAGSIAARKVVYTRKNRYGHSLEELSEIAKEKTGNKIVLHIIGVGGEDSPQVNESISAIKKSGKDVEVHIMDVGEDILQRATAKAKLKFPETPIFSHKIDILSPNSLPTNKADISVCTNVLIHAFPWTHSSFGLYHLSSMMKKGGYVLVDDSEVGSGVFGVDKFGLELKKRVKEDYLIWITTGAIMQKTGDAIPFHEVLKGVKRYRKEMRI